MEPFWKVAVQAWSAAVVMKQASSSVGATLGHHLPESQKMQILDLASFHSGNNSLPISQGGEQFFYNEYNSWPH
jgi:hypothetical protein